MISVAMATYNGEQYIGQQLRSVLSQTLPPDEIVICDDCSTDSTVQIIKKIISETPDCRIRLVENAENLGYIQNFYKAIRLTRGDYIFLADQDDVWHPDKMGKTMQAMKEVGASVVCTNFDLIDQNGAPIADRNALDINPFVSNVTERLTRISFDRLIIGNIVQGCTYCFTREVKEAYLRVNSSHLIHDYQIMFVAALIGDAYFLDEKLIDYRLHTNNAVGFGDVAEARRIHWKIPTVKPVMVRFIEDLGRGISVPHEWYYKLLYYLRIPYFISVLEKKRQYKKESNL